MSTQSMASPDGPGKLCTTCFDACKSFTYLSIRVRSAESLTRSTDTLMFGIWFPHSPDADSLRAETAIQRATSEMRTAITAAIVTSLLRISTSTTRLHVTANVYIGGETIEHFCCLPHRRCVGQVQIVCNLKESADSVKIA